MNRPIFLSSFFSAQRSGSKLRISPAMRQSNPLASNWVMGPMALRPACKLFQTSWVPIPEAQTRPTPVTTTRRLKVVFLLCGTRRPAAYFFACACFSIYAMASLTVAIFSASSSGISMPNASSKAITSSTVSSESAPKSSTNEAVGVTSPSSTPSCSTMICLTRSSTLAILSIPPLCGISGSASGCSDCRSGLPIARPFYAPPRVRSTAADEYVPSRRAARCSHRTAAGAPRSAPVPRPCAGARARGLRLRHVHPAVDVQHVAGDVAGLVAGQKDNGRGDLFIGAHPPERDPGNHRVLDLLRQRIGHRRGDEARRNGIDGDVARGHFDGDGLGQPNQSGLGRHIVRLAGVAGLRNHRGDVNDPARAPPQHRSERLLQAEVRA